MTPQHVADITPGGTPTAIGAAGVRAYRVLLLATDASARVGDATIGATAGCKIGTSVPLVISVDFRDGGIDLSELYVWASAGSVSVTYFT